MKLEEGDLSIDFTDAIDGFVFDQMKASLPNYHGISEMHRVDFIVELKDFFLFVEVKDPENPKAKPEGLVKFFRQLSDGTLSKTFACKFIGSFIYRWAENKLEKPIHYINLVTLETALLINFSDEIAKHLPPMGRPVDRWQKAFIESCQVFNIETWNAQFPKWPVQRLSSLENPTSDTQPNTISEI